jgi:hypothetical protein
MHRSSSFAATLYSRCRSIPCTESSSAPDPHLVDVLKEAQKLQQFLLANRSKSIWELAREKRMGPTPFTRLLRANYRAQDIQQPLWTAHSLKSSPAGTFSMGQCPSIGSSSSEGCLAFHTHAMSVCRNSPRRVMPHRNVRDGGRRV